MNTRRDICNREGVKIDRLADYLFTIVIWIPNISSATPLLLLPTTRAPSSVSFLLMLSGPILFAVVMAVFPGMARNWAVGALDVAKVSIGSLHSGAGPCHAWWGDALAGEVISIDCRHHLANTRKIKPPFRELSDSGNMACSRISSYCWCVGSSASRFPLLWGSPDSCPLYRENRRDLDQWSS